MGRGRWVLLRRAPHAGWERPAVKGALDGGPAALVRDHRDTGGVRRPVSQSGGPRSSIYSRNPDLFANIASPTKPGVAGRRLFAICSETKLRRVLARMLDETRFLSSYGIRSLSRHHLEHPYVFNVHGHDHSVGYLPAESNNGMFGGNSNWRGPIWSPVNVLIIRALLHFSLYYGEEFKVECPTGSGKQMSLFEVSREIANRLISIFLRDKQGQRPVYGGSTKFQTDPHWRDHILFYEYFHGDNGAGLGASHQTGWTGLVGALILLFGGLTEKEWLEKGVASVATQKKPSPAERQQEQPAKVKA